jgi:hypothetical protein
MKKDKITIKKIKCQVNQSVNDVGVKFTKSIFRVPIVRAKPLV